MKRLVSRRDFLQLAGSLGGSTAVYRAAMGLKPIQVGLRAAE